MLTQKEIGEHLDLDQSQVSRLCQELAIDWKTAGLDPIRIAYIQRLREQAAGRATAGDLDLATERARLAREQADKVAMQNAVTRGELTPTVLLEQVLAGTASRIAGILDAIPGLVKRRVPELKVTDIEAIAAEIIKVRNTVAAMSLSDVIPDTGEESIEPISEELA